MTLTTFDIDSASRIANVVRFVERQPGKGKALAFDSASASFRSRPVFRMCTFTGSWNKSASKAVTLLGKTATLTAINLFADIGTATSNRSCAIARDGTAWYLIAAEC